MDHEHSVPLKTVVKKLNLETLYYPKLENDVSINHSELMRPGLAFSGFFKGFVPERISLVGRTEISYLEELDPETLYHSVEKVMEKHPRAMIITQKCDCTTVLMELAEKYDVPLLRAPENTTHLASQINAILNIELAPRTLLHGVMMEIYGIGVLLMGESGVGKSETALELVKRGHRLVADDSVEVRRTSPTTLMAKSPDNIRDFMELRGVGIINVSRMFGIGAVKQVTNVNHVILLDHYDSAANYDRIGLTQEYTDILGIKVPKTTIPVTTGRNLAVIIEAETMNHRQRVLGYNAAEDLMKQLGYEDETEDQIQPHGMEEE